MFNNKILSLILLFSSLGYAQICGSITSTGYYGNTLALGTGSVNDNNFIIGPCFIVSSGVYNVVDFKVFIGASATGTYIIYLSKDTNTSGSTMVGGTVLCSASTSSLTTLSVNTFSSLGCPTLTSGFRYWLWRNNNSATIVTGTAASGNVNGWFMASTCCTIPANVTGTVGDNGTFDAIGMDLTSSSDATCSNLIALIGAGCK